ncbi:isochorismatase family protein [Mycobacterium sp. AZCC_0083]|uniref:isochorismatase family protein n=1 Tax=Mycobacterium sp. AZCC_0083 TaxID=2735882 RepID=UPI001616C55C|nr:isochorismatase family protein [Mycobacterium sp. AZCC_0083]MBB5167832.1 nicotinamidase-related amidase [Mycobacterium sp. AZCC_0083]
MTLSAIEDNAALIVLDLQVATAGMPTTPNTSSDIFEHSARLAKAFRDKNLPVVWVNVAGGSSGRVDVSPQMGDLPENWTDLPEELGVAPSDKTFSKFGWGAFHDDRMEALLMEVGAGQLFLTGVTTSQAVESTARSAHERNYHVVVVTDAIGDLDAHAHSHSVNQIFPKLAELATTEEVLARL